MSIDTGFWSSGGLQTPLGSLQKQEIKHAHATCRPMAGNGLFVPSFTRWRERETEAQRGIGGTYRKSVGQMSHECLEDGSAPSFVTTLGRHGIGAALVVEGQIGLVAHECLSGSQHSSSVAVDAQ